MNYTSNLYMECYSFVVISEPRGKQPKRHKLQRTQRYSGAPELPIHNFFRFCLCCRTQGSRYPVASQSFGLRKQPVMDELRWLNCYALAVMDAELELPILKFQRLQLCSCCSCEVPSTDDIKQCSCHQLSGRERLHGTFGHRSNQWSSWSGPSCADVLHEAIEMAHAIIGLHG